EVDRLTDDDQRFALRATQEIVEELASLVHEKRKKDHTVAADEDASRPAVSVLACPARDETDEIALQMLKESLDPRRFEVSLVSPALLASEVVALVEEKRPMAICIAALPPGGMAHTRLLCLRLRSRFPDVKILVGRWGLKGSVDKNRDQIVS